MPKISLIFFFCFCFGKSFAVSDSLKIEAEFELLIEKFRDDTAYFNQKIPLLLAYADTIKSDYFRAKSYSVMGEMYLLKGQYDVAENYLFKALDLRIENEFLPEAGSTHEAIAQLMFALNELEKGLDHLKKSQQIKEKIGNPRFLMPLYNQLGSGFYNLGELDSAYWYYNQSLEIALTLQDSQLIAASYSCLGDFFYQDMDDMDEATEWYQQSIALYEAQEKWSESVIPLFNLGNLYAYIDQPDSALHYYLIAKKRVEKSQSNRYLGTLLLEIANTYTQLNQPDAAYQELMSYVAYRDSIFNAEKMAKILENEERFNMLDNKRQLAFEREEKAKIAALNANKKWTIYGLVILLFLLIITTLLWFRQLHQKAKLNSLEMSIKNQEIDSLLKKQEAKSYAAMLEGQNEERKRIAQDLHDRLGGTLAAVKLQFNRMDEKITALQDEKQQMFQSVNGMLNEAVEDVRRISHDLVSGRLTEVGLKGAVEDMVELLNQSERIEVHLHIDSELPKVSKKEEQTIYSVLQELMSNALKHAEASKIEIQMNRQFGNINILFEDNGKGFSPDKSVNQGMGLSSVKNRIEKMNGEILFDSFPGRGTIVNITIPL